MVRSVQDLSSASAQPNAPLTGGGYYNTSAFQAGPNIEKFAANVIDNRASGSTGIPPGKLYVEQFTAANTGGAFYTLSATANAALPMFSYGILLGVPLPVQSPASVGFSPGSSTGQNQAYIIQKGDVNAFCTTGAVAIAVGTPLVADGAGNLTAAVGGATAPTIGTITTYGTAGAATVTYQAYARNTFGLDSGASTAVSVTTANATLSPTNGNVVPITIPAGTSQVVVVRTAGGPSQGVVGIFNVAPGATATTFVDSGMAAGGAYAAPAAGTYPAGTVLAISKGTLAGSTSTPTLVAVSAGGY